MDAQFAQNIPIARDLDLLARSSRSVGLSKIRTFGMKYFHHVLISRLKIHTARFAGLALDKLIKY